MNTFTCNLTGTLIGKSEKFQTYQVGQSFNKDGFQYKITDKTKVFDFVNHDNYWNYHCEIIKALNN